MNANDNLIRTLYTLVTEDRWEHFRADALMCVAEHFGAGGAAWVTHSDAGAVGEFNVFPEKLSMQPMTLISLPFKGGDEITLNEAPAPGLKKGLALRYKHQSGNLISVMAFWFAAAGKTPDGAQLQLVGAHLAEAGQLALAQYIQRDEWLFRLGRSNRGTAALVDEHGTVYAASRRFRALLAELADGESFQKLPFVLPEAAFEEQGQFAQGGLHFRAARVGRLQLLHARKPMPLDGLSPREQEIARALAAGRTFKTVARNFGIAISTVANHASRIYKKLSIYRREELVALLRKPGQNDPGDA
ncbi:MAG: LuxR C-terminal-related transcriptional regulator [Pseudomonadota bacterium]